MKLKRIAACALALVLALPGLKTAASAATFPDVTGSYAWAAQYISDMAEKGIFKGYEDGTFRPAQELTVGQALALCARVVGVEDDVAAEIEADRDEELTEILGSDLSWFRQDFALCMELGVATATELKALYRAGSLNEAISKELFSVYLVRAIGLDRMADSLVGYSLSFADLSDITAAYRPYVYLLSAYGIVQGTEENKFEPKMALNRAVSATMLSRIVDLMDEKGLTVELPEYSDYDWTSGTVVSTAAGDGSSVVLTLTTPQGSETITLPSSAPIYLDNMETAATAIQTGMYARVCLNDDDPVSVRLVAASRMESVSAELVSFTKASLTLRVSGVDKTYAINRFTQVTVGGKTGDRDLIDLTAGYSRAVCTVDGSDVLLLQLTGGTSAQTGLISSVTVGTTTTALQVISFDGVTRAFTVPSTASVTINGLTGTLKSSHKGYYVSLRVSNDEAGVVTSAAVNTEAVYIRGKVLGVTYTSTPSTIYVKNLDTGLSVSYPVADSAVLTYEGATVALKNVTKGWYLTAKLNTDGKITVLEAYEGETTLEGTLTAISYGTDTVLTVTDEDGTVYSFTLDMSDLPTFYRSDATSTVDKLRAGDTVTVTSQLGEVTTVESWPQAANVTGTITRIIQETSGSTLELTLTDGTAASYTITAATSITKDGKTVALTSLQPGYTLALVVSGDQVTSVEVEDTTTETSSTQITGTVLYVNTSAKTLLLQLTDSSGTGYVVTVNAPSGTSVLSVAGSSLSLAKLVVGDTVTVYGAYDGGEFDATIVIRQS